MCSDLLNIVRLMRKLFQNCQIVSKNIAQEMLTTFHNDLDLLKKIITRDESWVYGYDIETKDQSSL